MRQFLSLAVLALLSCTWAGTGNPSGARPGSLPDKVRIVIGDTTYDVRQPIIHGDSLSGQWRLLKGFTKGEWFQRTEALQRIREIKTFRVTEAGAALGIVSLGAGWCLGAALDDNSQGDCF